MCQSNVFKMVLGPLFWRINLYETTESIDVKEINRRKFTKKWCATFNKIVESSVHRPMGRYCHFGNCYLLMEHLNSVSFIDMNLICLLAIWCAHICQMSVSFHIVWIGLTFGINDVNEFKWTHRLLNSRWARFEGDEWNIKTRLFFGFIYFTKCQKCLCTQKQCFLFSFCSIISCSNAIHRCLQ